MTDAPLLLFEAVSKWYGPVLALNQVSLELRGGITGLVGANGSGKSTLLKLATGQVRPTLGHVSVRGIPASDWRARRLIGYSPDHDAFYEDLTGQAFVRAMAKLCGYPGVEATRRADAALESVGMERRANQPLKGYSKGMRQRVKLAQALLHDPEFVILDEPLSGIDPVGRREMVALFRDLAARGLGLLVSSHELEELEKLTETVVILARGRIAAVGPLMAIRDRLDGLPTRIRIDTDRPLELARAMIGIPGLAGMEFDADGLTARAKNTEDFFRAVGTAVVVGNHRVRRLEPLDDSAHAILGYLLDGHGET